LLTVTLKALAVILITLNLPTLSKAQLPCLGVTTACVDHPSEPNTYKCISGPINVSQLINGPNPILLPPAQAETTPQRIVVKGTLTVDINTGTGGYTFSEGSEIVFADEASEIIIQFNCGLKLNKTSVHGCSSMWNRINAAGFATLIVENQCQIRDGICALEFHNNAKMSITDSYFDRNLLAVKIGREIFLNQQPISFAPGGGIWGNTISGIEQLKPPFNGLRPTNGILIQNTDNLTIGNGASGQNLFTSFENTAIGQVVCRGVSIVNSDVIILNSRFEFMAFNSTQQGDGAIGAISGSRVEIQGLGSGEGSTSTFQHCNTGVFLHNSSTEVTNVNFNTVRECVAHIQDAGSTSAKYVKVNNSRFLGFLKNGIIAERNFGALNLSAFEVQNCRFDDNALFLGLKKAITVSTDFPASGEKVMLNNNKVYFRDRGFFGTNFTLIGFDINNLNKGSGKNNEFFDEGPTGTRFNAIRMQRCNGFLWSNNDIIGNNTVGIPADEGFIVDESPNCVYNCNYLNSVRNGMTFYGLCNSSTLYQNSFNNHDKYGLHLAADGTVIGGQFKKYNTWGGGSGEAEAFMYFTSYNPFLPAHKFQVEKSLFTIQTSNQNTDFWADPRRVGFTGMGNDPHWFIEPATPTPPSINLCPAETIDPNDPKLDFGEKGIVNGTFIPWQGYPANTWDAALLLYQRMQDDPSLRPSGTPEAIWYANNYNGNLGKLWRVYDGFVSLSTDSPLASASQLLSDLNAIVLTTTHEQNLKTDLRIFLEMNITNSDTMTQAQTDLLNDIADQCRYEGGIGVVLARLALGQFSQREGDCSEGLRGTVGTNQDSQASIKGLNVSVFPNPAGQSLSVRLDQNVQNGTLRLVNLQGQIARTWEFSGNTVDIQDANVNPGVYFLEVQEQGAILSRNKVVFNR